MSTYEIKKNLASALSGRATIGLVTMSCKNGGRQELWTVSVKSPGKSGDVSVETGPGDPSAAITAKIEEWLID